MEQDYNVILPTCSMENHKMDRIWPVCFTDLIPPTLDTYLDTIIKTYC